MLDSGPQWDDSYSVLEAKSIFHIAGWVTHGCKPTHLLQDRVCTPSVEFDLLFCLCMTKRKWRRALNVAVTLKLSLQLLHLLFLEGSPEMKLHIQGKDSERSGHAVSLEDDRYVNEARGLILIAIAVSHRANETPHPSLHESTWLIKQHD